MENAQNPTSILVSMQAKEEGEKTLKMMIFCSGFVNSMRFMEGLI